MTVVRFRKRADVDDTATAIFSALATCRGLDTELVVRRFLDEQAHLKRADLVAIFSLARKVLGVLERHLGQTRDDDSGGGAA